MIFKPDPKTLAIIPWTSDAKQKSAVVIGDIYEAYGGKEPSDVCPRGYVAKRAVKEAEEMGFTSCFGPELEYFVFTSVDPTKLVWDLWVSPKGGAGDSWGAPRVEDQRKRTLDLHQRTQPLSTVTRSLRYSKKTLVSRLRCITTR